MLLGFEVGGLQGEDAREGRRGRVSGEDGVGGQDLREAGSREGMLGRDIAC